MSLKNDAIYIDASDLPTTNIAVEKFLRLYYKKTNHSLKFLLFTISICIVSGVSFVYPGRHNAFFYIAILFFMIPLFYRTIVVPIIAKCRLQKYNRRTYKITPETPIVIINDNKRNGDNNIY